MQGRSRATTTEPDRGGRLGGRRAYVVWIAAILAYSIAVLQRTTMGVSGLEATERFGTSPRSRRACSWTVTAPASPSPPARSSWPSASS